MLIPTLAKSNEHVDAVHQRILACAEALEELAPLWPEVRPVSLRWDLFRNVFVNAQNRSAYSALFGSYWPLRGYEGIWDTTEKLLRMVSPGRWSRPLQRPLHLPEDAVLFSLRDGNKLVIASASAGRILKLEHELRDLESEVRAWAIIQKAGIQPHVPTVFGHGETKDGKAWVLSEFVPNKNPLANAILPWSNAIEHWRTLIREEILPVLERFYEASGVELVTVAELLEKEKERLLQEEAPEPLWRLARTAEQAAAAETDAMAIRAEVHGDLHPGNVHRNGESWKLIDWGSVRREEVSLDMFKDYFWSFETPAPTHQAFWTWLREGISVTELPETLRADIERFTSWQAAWKGLRTEPSTLRCLLLTHLLRRTLRRVENFDLRAALEAGGSPQAIDGLGPLAHALSLRTLQQLRALGALD